MLMIGCVLMESPERGTGDVKRESWDGRDLRVLAFSSLSSLFFYSYIPHSPLLRFAAAILYEYF